MTTLKQIPLGRQGLTVSVEGLGCMGMTDFPMGTVYGQTDEKEAIATIHRALELGVTMLDTADIYGPFTNERLLQKALAGEKRAGVTIASKFGFEITDDGQLTMGLDGSPAYARKAIERSLSNLGTDHIDLYYLHRADPRVPIEETVGQMSRFVEEGKVRYLGLSEVTPEQLRAAHAVHPISALETEYSLFDRTVEENGVLAACRELGVGFVGYSPLGRGFLSGEITSPDDFAEDDSRRMFPRYQGENFYKNLELVEKLTTLAAKKGVTPAQLALAWVLAQEVVAIPRYQAPQVPGTQRGRRRTEFFGRRTGRDRCHSARRQRFRRGLPYLPGMRSAHDEFRVISTVTEYTEFCALPPPLHPLITVIDLETTRGAPGTELEPIVQNLYMIAIKRGLKGKLIYGRQPYDFTSGALIFMAPGQVFSLDPELDISEVTGWMILFHPDLLARYPLGKKILDYGFFGYDLNEALHLSAREEETLREVMRAIEREYQGAIDTFSQDVIVSQLETLLTYANRFYHRQFITRRTVENDLVTGFETECRAYFAKSDELPLPTVQYFADALSVSPAYLSDMLRSLTGRTTQQHIHAALIDKAKRLLLSTSMTVNETAYALGFEYPQYFSRLFKQKTGVTPGAFRSSAN